MKWWTTALTVVGACVAGFAGFFAGRFDYSGRVVWSLTDPSAPAHAFSALRKELLDHLSASSQAAAGPWDVEVDPPARTLALRLTAHELAPARAWLTKTSQAFIDHLEAVVASGRRQAGPAELVLMERREHLDREAAALKKAAEGAPEPHPRAQYDETRRNLENRLAGPAATCGERRKRVAALEAELAALRGPPAAGDAGIDPQVREQAIVADVDLQQDLKALRVQLAEARQLLLQVRAAAEAPLAELTAALAELSAVVSSEEARGTDDTTRQSLRAVAQSTADYESLLAAFTRGWNEDGERLAELEDDPRRAETIAIQQRLVDQLNAFLFQSGPPLAALRDQAKAVAEDPEAAARRHAISSALTRAFHLFQSAHHRLEFTAADAKPSQNFRLDAAMKSSQGLRRRSQERLRELEARLSAVALEDERIRRERRKGELESELIELRAGLDQAIQELIAAHDEVEAGRPEVERLLRASAELELDALRSAALRTESDQLHSRIEELAARRIAELPPARLEVVACSVDPRPVNLGMKLFQGGVSALAALLALTTLLFRGAKP